MALSPEAKAATARFQTALALVRDQSLRNILGAYWRMVDPHKVDTSWRRFLPVFEAIVSAGQLQAASLIDPYVNLLTTVELYGREQELRRLGFSERADQLAAERRLATSANLLVAAAFVGRTTEGVPIAEALGYDPVIVIKTALNRGMSPTAAMDAGLYVTSRMGGSEVVEAGRSALMVRTLADDNIVGYQRVLGPRSCDFCRMLAGRGPVYKRNTVAFKTHPGCTCVGEAVFKGEKRVEDVAYHPAVDPIPQRYVPAPRAGMRPSPAQLRLHAADNPERYRQLMVEHGYLVA